MRFGINLASFKEKIELLLEDKLIFTEKLIRYL
jgi:hypothetical protein